MAVNKETMKILIVDDYKTMLRIIRNLLAELGFKNVDEASDGSEALEKYAQAMKTKKPFDAVIMDLTVPGGMGGKDAIKKLLEIDPEVKVIVSSGYATDTIMSEYKKYGFTAVIAKPYSVSQLEETLRGLGLNNKHN